MNCVCRLFNSRGSDASLQAYNMDKYEVMNPKYKKTLVSETVQEEAEASAPAITSK